MKKVLFAIVIIVLVVICVAYLYVPQFAYQKITDFEPFTFERVLGDTAWVSEYEIGDYRKPEDYGYSVVEEVGFTSAQDKLQLSGWYIPATKEVDSTILVVHGRTSNRLKTMKYLELFKATGLDSLYNFFIPDMRNSGKSEASSTYMGYDFAEDIAGAVNYLAAEKDQQHFVLYSFSMGAMATFVYLHRQELGAGKRDIQRIIVDSPLTDVPGVLRLGSDKLGLPEVLYDETFELFNEAINGYAGELQMGSLLQQSNIPLFVIQSNHDATTPAMHTREQLAKLNGKQITTWFVDSVNHVKIYTHPLYREAYTSKVNSFLRGE
ncbi:MAG: alpha/beta hydrolase [Bacteroidota bacterium]